MKLLLIDLPSLFFYCLSLSEEGKLIFCFSEYCHVQELDGCANRFDNLAVKIVLLLATFLLEDVVIDLDFPSYL